MILLEVGPDDIQWSSSNINHSVRLGTDAMLRQGADGHSVRALRARRPKGGFPRAAQGRNRPASVCRPLTLGGSARLQHRPSSATRAEGGSAQLRHRPSSQPEPRAGGAAAIKPRAGAGEPPRRHRAVGAAAAHACGVSVGCEGELE